MIRVGQVTSREQKKEGSKRGTERADKAKPANLQSAQHPPMWGIMDR